MLVGRDAVAAGRRSAALRVYAVLVGTAVVVGLVDHLTKWLVASRLTLGAAIWPDAAVSIRHVENSGAAFGFLPQLHWVYLAVALLVGGYILFAAQRFGTTWYRQVILGMILGGALSNGIDRLVLGYVVDFIDLHWWPVFNAADASIVVGILLALLVFRRPAVRERVDA